MSGRRTLENYASFRRLLTHGEFGPVAFDTTMSTVMEVMDISPDEKPSIETFLSDSEAHLFPTYGRHWMTWGDSQLNFVFDERRMLWFDFSNYTHFVLPKKLRVPWSRLVFRTPFQDYIALLNQWKTQYRVFLITHTPDNASLFDEEPIIVIPTINNLYVNILFSNTHNSPPWRFKISEQSFDEGWGDSKVFPLVEITDTLKPYYDPYS